MQFFQKLEELQEKNNSLVCVGLDIDLAKVPQHLLKKHNVILNEMKNPDEILHSVQDDGLEDLVFNFNKSIIDATKDLVCAYKPNIAFYEALGIEGLKSLKKTVDYIHSLDIPVIVDSKRNDIGNTATAYAKGMLEAFEFDAMTVNPYMGKDTIEPFLEYKEKGIIVLVRTSNPGAADFQDLVCDGEPLYHRIMKECLAINKNNNVAFVMGATKPEELIPARKIAPNTTFLIPGLGAQGGDTQATIKNSVRKDGKGVIINSSRGIIFASNGEDFAEKAREETEKLRDEINKYR